MSALGYATVQLRPRLVQGPERDEPDEGALQIRDLGGGHFRNGGGLGRPRGALGGELGWR